MGGSVKRGKGAGGRGGVEGVGVGRAGEEKKGKRWG